MEKKEPVKKDSASAYSPGAGSSKIFSVIKFILGICLLPFVFSVSVSFFNEIGTIERQLQSYFWWGVVGFLVIYFFIWEPVIFYNKGQQLMEIIFSFFKPLVKFAPYALPIYTIILFVLYGIFSFVFRPYILLRHFIFLVGFSIALHIIFSGKTLRSKQGDFLKANYIFGFSLVYIINMSLLVFLLNLLIREFSFVNCMAQSFYIAKGIYFLFFSQLFL